MGFYGIIEAHVDFPDINEDKKQEIIKNINEYVTMDSVDKNSVTFSEESHFSYEMVDDLKRMLEELKTENKIKEGRIYIWCLEEPDETIYI